MDNRFNGLLDMDEDDIFMSSPKKKFFDIVYNANRNLVVNEIDEFLLRYIAMENLLSKAGYDIDKLSPILKSEIFNDSDMETKKNSLYIELTGKIITQNE